MIGLIRINTLGRAEELKKKSVAIAGAGNLGSKIANNLAKQGVGKLILIDQDVVEIENIGYQEFGSQDLGKSKVEALKSRLEEMHPWVKVDAHKMHVLGLGSPILDDEEIKSIDLKLREIISEADCVVSSFDSAWPRLTILLYSIAYSKPVIFASAWSSGSQNKLHHYGRINTWKPGYPCFLCYTYIRKGGGDGYVAHSSITWITASICSLYTERVLLGLEVGPYVTIDLQEEKDEFRVEKYYVGEQSKSCICNKAEDLRKTIQSRGIIGLLEKLEVFLR